MKQINKTPDILNSVLSALDDGKGRDVLVIDVREKTSFTDYMIIASGTSDRHVNALADQVADQARLCGIKPLGVEGKSVGDWVLVDLGEAIVHVMKPEIRAFYQLEKLWQGDYLEDEASLLCA